jgi:hypothetical protein
LNNPVNNVPEEIPTLSRHLLGEGANPMLENTLQVEETINLKNIFVPTTICNSKL